MSIESFDNAAAAFPIGLRSLALTDDSSSAVDHERPIWLPDNFFALDFIQELRLGMVAWPSFPRPLVSLEAQMLGICADDDSYVIESEASQMLQAVKQAMALTCLARDTCPWLAAATPQLNQTIAALPNLEALALPCNELWQLPFAALPRYRATS